MNTLLKNPLVYCFMVPLALAAWPALLSLKWVPEARDALAREKQRVVDANELIQEILALDPGRLRQAGAAAGQQKRFDYASEVDRVAKACGIRAYEPRPDKPIRKNGQETQTAKVTLKDVGLVQATRFLSTLLTDWPDLECTKITLTPIKGQTDRWQMELAFSYSF